MCPYSRYMRLEAPAQWPEFEGERGGGGGGGGGGIRTIPRTSPYFRHSSYMYRPSY